MNMRIVPWNNFPRRPLIFRFSELLDFQDSRWTRGQSMAGLSGVGLYFKQDAGERFGAHVNHDAWCRVVNLDVDERAFSLLAGSLWT